MRSLLLRDLTVGGGVGLSVHAPFRIATESTKIAMPEVQLIVLFLSLFPSFTEINFCLGKNRRRSVSSPM